MRYLTLNEVLDLYYRILEQSGGAVGIRDLGALDSVDPNFILKHQEVQHQP